VILDGAVPGWFRDRKSAISQGIAMTVAVKNTPEISSHSMFDRLGVAGLAGVVYVLGAIAVVVKGLPALWWIYLGLPQESLAAWTLLIAAMFGAAVGFTVVGGKLLGPHPPQGSRAAIFVGLVAVGLIGIIVKWIGGVMEEWSFTKGWFTQPVGIGITAAIGVVMLIFTARLFFKPGFENFLRAMENQGWFHATSYKGSQGLKVRRGTMLGVMIIIGSGVWAYERTLQSGSDNWSIELPFTGMFTVRDRGDAALAPGLMKDQDWGESVRLLEPGDWPGFQANQIAARTDYENALAKLKDGRKIREGDRDRFESADFIVDTRDAFIVDKTAFDRVQKDAKDKIASFDPKLPKAADVLDRYFVQRKNKALNDDYVRITMARGTDKKFKAGDIITKSEFDSVIDERQKKISELDEEVQKLQAAGNAAKARPLEEQARELKLDMPVGIEPTPMEGAVQFQTFTLLPSVRIVLPLVMGALALWFSWRLVNLPSFADFLIATEAELNKVSWTPRRRLVQDTIVVLVTTILVTFFLLFADLIWSQLLTRVGVLRAPSKDTSAEVQSGGDELPW
jgi:preprotein translocase SecE subunit